MKTTERAKGILEQLGILFKDPDRLTGALTVQTIRRQSGPERPMDKWSIGNRLLVWMHKTEDARTFHQWANIGRSVRQGSKAFYLLAPIMKYLPDPDDEEKTRSIMLGVKGFPVFAQEDTQGEPLPPPPDYTPDELPPLADVAAAWGIKIRYAPRDARNAAGFYTPAENRITLCSYQESIFWHELGHAADERAHGPLKAGQDPKQEAVAELTAAVLARLHGQRTDRKTWEYLKLYTNDPQQMLAKVLPRVEAALQEILTATPEPVPA